EERGEQLRQPVPIAYVSPVVSEVLRNEVDLHSALRFEQLRFSYELGEPEGAMSPAHEWNRTECTAVIAAFANLEIANVREAASVDAHAWMEDGDDFDQAALMQLGNEATHLGGSKKEIDLR